MATTFGILKTNVTRAHSIAEGLKQLHHTTPGSPLNHRWLAHCPCCPQLRLLRLEQSPTLHPLPWGVAVSGVWALSSSFWLTALALTPGCKWLTLICPLTAQEFAPPELEASLLTIAFSLSVQAAAEDLDAAQTGHGTLPPSLSSVSFTQATAKLETSLNLSL